MLTARTLAPSSANLLGGAVHHNSALTKSGVLERAFTFAFRAMVYPQIWEDPRADLAALELDPQSRLAAIASGGCNVLSYLTAKPERIFAVDLNGTHVALVNLKLAALRYLPDYALFAQLFAKADDPCNVNLYDTYLAPHLDDATRAYWESRDLSGRRRITRFARNFYRFGLLGRFIGAGHVIARALGGDPRKLATATSMANQKQIFDEELAPLFDKPIIRWATSQRASLFGLGIPPAQYDALCDHGRFHMADVLRMRVERLATAFDFKDNYFAWQAFTRSYDPQQTSLPPYLAAEHFATLRAAADSVSIDQDNLILFLDRQPQHSLNRYSLLDAQDWMDSATLNALWQQITRTAQPFSRVIFRTAGERDILPGRVAPEILSSWSYDAARSREIHAMDRSAIYGAFHLYIKNR